MSLDEVQSLQPADANDGLRLLVVSNRLPVTITKDASGNYQYKMSSGGLVSALSGLKRMMKFTWIGWPGIDIPEGERALVQQELLEKHSCLPVFIDDEIADMHYNGFSNRLAKGRLQRKTDLHTPPPSFCSILFVVGDQGSLTMFCLLFLLCLLACWPCLFRFGGTIQHPLALVPLPSWRNLIQRR